jgi:hypothetical protein
MAKNVFQQKSCIFIRGMRAPKAGRPHECAGGGAYLIPDEVELRPNEGFAH